jgi:hypothetical protein
VRVTADHVVGTQRSLSLHGAGSYVLVWFWEMSVHRGTDLELIVVMT